LVSRPRKYELFMKFQTIACAVAIATGGFFFTHVVNDAIAANSNEVVSKAIQSSQEDIELLSAPQVGGVILFGRNIESPAQVRALTDHMRQVRPDILIAGVRCRTGSMRNSLST
jgi:hypothetical protein